MRLGVSSYAFGWAVGVPGREPDVPFTERDLLDFARRHGLGVVQIGDHIPLHAFAPARLEELRDAAAQAGAGIELEIGARGLTEPHLARYIELAGILRARLIRFVIDGPDHKPTAREVIALLRAFRPRLEDGGVTLGLENHDRFPARVLREIVERSESPGVGICLDTANSFGAGEGLAEVLRELAPLTVNLHVKDFTIRRLPYAMGFTMEGRPAGRGMLDVTVLCDALAPHGRCRTAVLETWTPPEPDLTTTLAKERAWTEESIAYLKPRFAP
jgi:sugar phosphate isomerase/epimerase